MAGWGTWRALTSGREYNYPSVSQGHFFFWSWKPWLSIDQAELLNDGFGSDGYDGDIVVAWHRSSQCFDLAIDVARSGSLLPKKVQRSLWQKKLRKSKIIKRKHFFRSTHWIMIIGYFH